MAAKTITRKTTVTRDDAHEVWVGTGPMSGWTWYVLKAYKNEASEARDPYARWFCLVVSPYCPEGELGDTYVGDITKHARRTIKRR